MSEPAIVCPSCHSEHVVKNGRIHNGKQNYRCYDCRRQFVLNPQNDEATGEILAVVASGNDTADCEVISMLLEQIEGEIEQVSADGAYDTRTCHEVIRDRGAKAVIPPRKGAKIGVHGNPKAQRHQRDENLRQIRRRGRKRWKQDSQYHRRSIAETGMFRFKITFGDRLSSRLFDNQATEMFVKCAALNRMFNLCKPDSYAMTG
jgi:hypothetical protein